jgi:hypothetical protein
LKTNRDDEERAGRASRAYVLRWGHLVAVLAASGV